MSNKRQLDGSVRMPARKRYKPDEVLDESLDVADSVDVLRDSEDIFGLDADLKNYETYKRGLDECEYFFGMINKLAIIEEAVQDNEASFRCPVCFQAFTELFQLNSHECTLDDPGLFQDGYRSSNISTALTSTRKDIGELLQGIPSSLLSEHQVHNGNVS